MHRDYYRFFKIFKHYGLGYTLNNGIRITPFLKDDHIQNHSFADGSESLSELLPPF